jgi:hypothetical protein
MQSTKKTGKTPGQTGHSSRNWSPKWRKAKLVGEFVPKLMQPAFEKFGFPAAAILTDWAAIAGADLAKFTAPERLKWPRKDHGNDDASQQKGATLILRVSGARALEVDHMRPRIIERINASFGYRAVSEIKLLQAPLPGATGTPRPAPIADCSDDPLLADLPESPLKAALARLSNGMKAKTEQAEQKPVQRAFTGNSLP